METTTHWVHDLDPVLLNLGGPFAIRYYGLAYLVSFALAWGLLRLYYRRGRSPLDDEAVSTAMTVLVAGVLIGGRLGFMLLYDLRAWAEDPLLVFRLWEGGMASHGGFVGVMVAIWWLARRFKMSFLRLGDMLCTLVPIGLLLGRIANFINGELWGRVSDVPWAVIFPESAPAGTPVSMIAPRHPSQLYEAGLEGALLLAWVQWRWWRTDAPQRPGRLSGEFLLGYAVARIICVQFREPDASLILGMTRGTFYSVFLGAAGAGLIALDVMKRRRG